MNRNSSSQLAAYKLDMHFDPIRLQLDLAGLSGANWNPHFDQSLYDFGWNSMPLRAVSGSMVDQSKSGDFKDTSALENSPYFQAVVQSFEAPLARVRLLRLEAGAVVKEHVDADLNYDFGQVRIHIPILTHPEVHFMVDGCRIIMLPGEVWYLDATYPHAVANNGRQDRIHLVLDATVNDWIENKLSPMFGPPSRARRWKCLGRVSQYEIRKLIDLKRNRPAEFKKRLRGDLRWLRSTVGREIDSLFNSNLP
jgi:quercetin dioxygenase-like cupin family protein